MKKLILITLLLLLNIARANKIIDESELGITSANGNTKTQTYNLKQSNAWEDNYNIIQFKGRFLNGFAQGNETARYLNLGLRYERKLVERLHTFLGEVLERDKFANINYRHITDAGLKYFFVKENSHSWFAEVGYRYMIEHRYDLSTVKSSYLRGYTEAERKLDQRLSLKYWLEYLPNLSHNQDYQVNTELSLVVMLSEIFSMKNGFLLRYDNLPAPGVDYKTDTLLSTALVAKF